MLIYYIYASEQVEYPFGDGCYYSQKWYQIDEVEFRVFHKNEDGTYYDPMFNCTLNDTFENLHDDAFYNHRENVKNESNQMSLQEEIDFLLYELEKQKLKTKENIAWVYYWATYRHTEMENCYERSAAARAKETINP